MYKFFLIQWKLGRVTREQIDNAVKLGYLTEQQAEIIKEAQR